MNENRGLRHDLEMLGASPQFLQSLDEAEQDIDKVIDAAFKIVRRDLEYGDFLEDGDVLSLLEGESGLKLYYDEDYRKPLLVVNVKFRGFPNWIAVEKSVANKIGMTAEDVREQLAQVDIDEIFWENVQMALEEGSSKLGKEILVAGRSGGYWGFMLEGKMLALDENKTKHKLRELYNTEEWRDYARRAYTVGDFSEATPEEKGKILAEYFLEEGSDLYEWTDVLTISPEWINIIDNFKKWVEEVIRDFESTEKWVDIIMDNNWVVKDSQSRSVTEETKALNSPEADRKIPQRVAEILGGEAYHIGRWRWSDSNDTYAILLNTGDGYPFTVIMGLFNDGIGMGLFEGHSKSGRVSEMKRLSEVPFQNLFPLDASVDDIVDELKKVISWLDRHIEPVEEAAENLPEFEVEVDLEINYMWESDEIMRAELDYNGKGSFYLRPSEFRYGGFGRHIWLDDISAQMSKSGNGSIKVERGRYVVEAKNAEEAKKLAMTELKNPKNWDCLFTRGGEVISGDLKVTVTDVKVEIGDVEMNESTSMRGTILSWICETCGSHVSVARRDMFMGRGKQCYFCGRRPQAEDLRAVRKRVLTEARLQEAENGSSDIGPGTKVKTNTKTKSVQKPILTAMMKKELPNPYEIQPGDIGRFIDSPDGSFGRVQKSDVGRQVMLRGDLIYMETLEQMLRRKGIKVEDETIKADDINLEIEQKVKNKYNELRDEMEKIYKELRNSEQVIRKFGRDFNDPQLISIAVMKQAGEEMRKRHPEISDIIIWAIDCSLGLGICLRQDMENALKDIKRVYFQK